MTEILDLKQELGARLFADFITETGLTTLTKNHVFLQPSYFQKQVEKLKIKDTKLYRYIQKNIIEGDMYKGIKEIEINKKD